MARTRPKTKSRTLRIEERLAVMGFVTPLSMAIWYAVTDLTRNRRTGMDKYDHTLDSLIRIGGMQALEWLKESQGLPRVERAIARARAHLEKEYPQSRVARKSKGRKPRRSK